jgi:3-phosphoshikimate 1-carboxyvinyltransferase
MHMGCKVVRGKDFIELAGADLNGLGEVDMNDYPDIVMPLAVVSAFANGETKITNVEHLRIKESDRLSVTVNALKQLGADAEAGKDYLLVRGCKGEGMHGAVIDSQNDHRIAMSFYVAGLKVPGVSIENERAVDKSFPDFYEQIEKILVKNRRQ